MFPTSPPPNRSRFYCPLCWSFINHPITCTSVELAGAAHLGDLPPSTCCPLMTRVSSSETSPVRSAQADGYPLVYRLPTLPCLQSITHPCFFMARVTATVHIYPPTIGLMISYIERRDLRPVRHCRDLHIAPRRKGSNCPFGHSTVLYCIVTACNSVHLSLNRLARWIESQCFNHCGQGSSGRRCNHGCPLHALPRPCTH